MDNKEDREWILENVESINADTKDIDEICCALEHSTIFATEYIQTFATSLIKLEYDNKNLQQELERYKNIIDKTVEYVERLTNGKTSRIDTWENVEFVLETILSILKGE